MDLSSYLFQLLGCQRMLSYKDEKIYIIIDISICNLGLGVSMWKEGVNGSLQNILKILLLYHKNFLKVSISSIWGKLHVSKYHRFPDILVMFQEDIEMLIGASCFLVVIWIIPLNKLPLSFVSHLNQPHCFHLAPLTHSPLNSFHLPLPHFHKFRLSYLNLSI